MSDTLDNVKRREALLVGCLREMIRLVDATELPGSDSVVDFDGVERRQWISILSKARRLVGK